MPIKPKLRFFDLTMIIVSMVIGIGIFRNPSIIAQHAGSESIFFTAWIVGALVSICGALTFAEIGSRFPVAGGYYKMFSICFHPSIAFMLIWTYLMLDAGATAAVCYTGAQYITPLVLPVSLRNPTGDKVMFFAIIAILFSINYAGIRTGARAQNLLSLVKIALMLIFISAIFFVSGNGHEAASPGVTEPGTSSADFFKALGVSLIAVYFTYGGYQNTANLGADVLNPQKNIPKGILTAIAIVMALYLAINFVYVQALGFENIQRSPLIAADLGKVLFGNSGAAFASVAIFISVLGFVNSSLLYNPRVMYAMAEEGILPKKFMKVHEVKQVQEFALTFFTAIIILFFVLLQTYNNLLNYVMFNDTIALAAAAFCIFLLRIKKTGDEIPGYRIKWFPLVPAVFILMQLVVTGYVVYSDPKNSLIGFIVMLVGFPLFLILKFFSNKKIVPV